MRSAFLTAVAMVGLWLIVLISLYLMLNILDAQAHSWYDPECCNDADCKQDDGVEEVTGGFRVPNGEIVPYGDKRIRRSLDGDYHWCHIGAHTYCVYVPGGDT